MTQRGRFKQTDAIQYRLTAEAIRWQEEAKLLPPGSSETNSCGRRVRLIPPRIWTSGYDPRPNAPDLNCRTCRIDFEWPGSKLNGPLRRNGRPWWTGLRNR
jgi:hypothetical protein